MQRHVLASCILTFLCFFAHTRGQTKVEPPPTKNASSEFFTKQGEVMDCIPPSFLLVSEVDLDSRTISGLSTIELKSGVAAYGLSFELDDVKLTNARRTPINENQLKKLAGHLIVMTRGKQPLSAAYLGLFQEDTVVLSVLPSKE